MGKDDQSKSQPNWGYNGKNAGIGPFPHKGIRMSNGQIKYDPFPYNSINDREFVFDGFGKITVPADLEFVPYQPDVRKDIDIHVIFSTLAENEQGPDLAILRYGPGAFVALHEHMGHEMVLVLTGDYIENGVTYLPGSLILRSPGTYHTMASRGGCQILASRYVKVKQRPDLWNEFAAGNEGVYPIG